MSVIMCIHVFLIYLQKPVMQMHVHLIQYTYIKVQFVSYSGDIDIYFLDNIALNFINELDTVKTVLCFILFECAVSYNTFPRQRCDTPLPARVLVPLGYLHPSIRGRLKSLEKN